MPIVLSVFSAAFAQEALKSTEEEYYDFLSLTGAAERPTLRLRTKVIFGKTTISEQNALYTNLTQQKQTGSQQESTAA